MTYPTGPRRYRLVRLRDGRIHATDNLNPRVCYLLSPRPPGRPAYGLASTGEIRVTSGRLTDVSERAASSGYRIGRGFTGDISLTRVDDPKWQLSYSRTGAATPRDRFAVVDLQDGGLLLLDGAGVHELSVVSAAPLEKQGTALASSDMEWFEDFTP